MFTVTMNYNSWHRRIANFAHRRVWGDETDICSYTRAFCIGLFWLLFAVCFSVLMLTWISMSIYTLSMLILAGVPLPEYSIVFWGMFTVSVLAISVVAGMMMLIEYRRERKWKAIRAGTYRESFASTVYTKFRSKTCFRIKFVD